MITSPLQDDVVECRTEVEEKCKPNTSGYTTTTECSKWPREVCRWVLNRETLIIQTRVFKEKH